MSFLKKSLSTLLLFIFIGMATLYSQENIINAFNDSYVHEKNKEYTKAIEKLSQVYQAGHYELNLRLGWLYYLNGKTDLSIEYYGKASALKPYALEPRFGLAYPLAAQGKTDELLTLYEKILEIDPKNTLANYRLGLIYYNKAQYVKAEEYLEKVINLYPWDYDSVLLMAWTKLKLQKNKDANVLFNKVLLWNKTDESALEGLKYVK